MVALLKDGASEGFRVPGLIRFVNDETPYLSNTNGGARMFVNLEDHLSHTLKKPNLEFEVRPYILAFKTTRVHRGMHASCCTHFMMHVIQL